MIHASSTVSPLTDELYISDAGMETYFIFHEQVQLPCNAAYVLMESAEGMDRLRRYYERYLAIAREFDTGFILETPTWRANPDWAAKIGTSPSALESINRRSIDLLAEIRQAGRSRVAPLVISGAIGPRRDGYKADQIMTPLEAADYHAVQIGHFRRSEAQVVSAFTMTNIPEAAGIVFAAQAAGLPSVISFTLETDGRLPTGHTLREAVEEVDASTGGGPAHYMINCAHPEHFIPAFESRAAWTQRVRGIRANSSNKSHAELDESTTLDDGNPQELGGQYRSFLDRFPHINVLGGCCGTDHRHVREIAAACVVGV